MRQKFQRLRYNAKNYSQHNLSGPTLHTVHMANDTIINKNNEQFCLDWKPRPFL